MLSVRTQSVRARSVATPLANSYGAEKRADRSIYDKDSGLGRDSRLCNREMGKTQGTHKAAGRIVRKREANKRRYHAKHQDPHKLQLRMRLELRLDSAAHEQSRVLSMTHCR